MPTERIAHNPKMNRQYVHLHSLCNNRYNQLGVTNHWTGLLDWNTGLDYWTDIFLVFTHSEVGFIESC